jgi:nitrous oxidase accessory protein
MHFPSLIGRGGPSIAVVAMLGLALAFVTWTHTALAAEVTVDAGGSYFADAIAAAQAGDTLVLAAGDHAGGVVISTASLRLTGEPGARIVGSGEGTVLTLAASDIEVHGLTITGSGLRLSEEDSGIFVTSEAARAIVEDCVLDDNLIGVYLKGPHDAVVRGNEIRGRTDLRMNERGNGVQIWNSPGAVVERNIIQHGRDGIFVTTSERNRFHDNEMSNLRFAVHYMYTNDSEITANRSFGNDIGFAIMYSSGLQIIANRSESDREHGFLLNYTNGSELSGNTVTSGGGKCVFIYNANKNTLRGNLFEGCDIGVHFTAGSERNVISENAFWNNRTQVKYVGTTNVEWSSEGLGNYWSDNAAFDLDGDGIADTPYRPNDLVDQIVWRHPLAMLLLSSPVTQIIGWAQTAFPSLRPGGVVDSFPLMNAHRGRIAQELE